MTYGHLVSFYCNQVELNTLVLLLDVRELEGVMCQESFRKRPLEQNEHAYLSLGAKQRRICEEMNSIKQQPYFITNGGFSTKSMKETEISITGPEDSGRTELQSQNNSSYQNKSLAAQQTRFL